MSREEFNALKRNLVKASHTKRSKKLGKKMKKKDKKKKERASTIKPEMIRRE